MASGRRDANADVREFFTYPNHWIYQSKGTPSNVHPDSVYHVSQLEVLFEDKYFHWHTSAAVRDLRASGFLSARSVPIHRTQAIVVWRKRNNRYVQRKIRSHTRIIGEYSADTLNKATGDYAETLVLLGLRGLHLELAGKSANSYKGEPGLEPPTI